jgi:hypothetical protein
MTERIEIQGGAGEFEAAVIGVVLDRIAEEEVKAKEGRPDEPSQPLPAWMRALHPEDPDFPRETVRPE